jgi:hypothetical protein
MAVFLGFDGGGDVRSATHCGGGGCVVIMSSGYVQAYSRERCFVGWFRYINGNVLRLVLRAASPLTLAWRPHAPRRHVCRNSCWMPNVEFTPAAPGYRRRHSPKRLHLRHDMRNPAVTD